MSDRLTVLKLTDEQTQQVLHLLNQGQNVFGELRLCNLPGEQSEPHLFLGLLGPKAAATIRRAIEKDAPNQPTL